MTNITTGTGATLAANTTGQAKLEEMLVALLRFGNQQERTPARNPNNIQSIASASTDEETLIFTASVSFPVQLTVPTATTPLTNGQSVAIATDYLTGVTFTHGTGSTTLKATNWVQAIIEASLLQFSLEIDVIKNPTGRQGVQPSFTAASPGAINNFLFECQYELPLAQSLNGAGALSTYGLEYLGNL